MNTNRLLIKGDGTDFAIHYLLHNVENLMQDLPIDHSYKVITFVN